MCRSWTLAGSTASKRGGEEIGLLLVVALQADPVAGPDHGLQQRGGVARLDDLALGQLRAGLQPGVSRLAALLPGRHASMLLRVVSPVGHAPDTPRLMERGVRLAAVPASQLQSRGLFGKCCVSCKDAIDRPFPKGTMRYCRRPVREDPLCRKKTEHLFGEGVGVLEDAATVGVGEDAELLASSKAKEFAVGT